MTVIVTGALAGLACAAIVGEGWNPAAAMVLGMALGMVVAFVAGTLAGMLFGAFELMIPTMLSGMAAGMVIAMQSTAGICFTAAMRLGAGLGLVVLVFTYLMNTLLRGEVKRWTS